jgi:selenocysteine lyase/cysteine desulfurase
VAAAFNRGIGLERKAARLRYLRDRWAKALMAESSRIKVPTPLNNTQSCGIALLSVEGIETDKLFGWLWNKHRIRTTPINHAEFNGLRITPSIYTMPAEFDVFVDVVRNALKTGVA